MSSTIPSVAPTQMGLAREAALRVVEVHSRLTEFLRPGITLAEVDRFVAITLGDLKCKSCFLGYRSGGLPPFPSHACLSVNDCVVHGTAASLQRPLETGDLVKIDIGVLYKSWIGDAAWTYSLGEPTKNVRALMDASKNSLRLGIEQLCPGNTFMDWAKAVQGHVETECGLFLVKGLGGHGYGRRLHTPPFISNTVVGGFNWPEGGQKIKPGTLVAVEPMLAIGTGETKSTRGEWPIYSADGSMTVHHEHDVYIGEDGPETLTAGLYDLPDVLG